MDGESPDRKKTQKDFLLWMCRHLVGLVANVAVHGDEGKVSETGVLAYSGFVIRMHGEHFFVTAGHCIEDLETFMEHPKAQVWGIGFMDSFGEGALYKDVLPFHYDVGDALSMDRVERHLDFAVIHLPDLVWKGLESNGVKAVLRGMWQDRPERKYFQCAIAGLPGYLRKEPVEPGRGWNLQSVGVGVEQLRPEDVPEQPAEGWFVGRIRPTEAELLCIKGMSGGPIFGFWKNENGQTCYDIVALQSRWDKKERIVFGCPLASFAEVLYQVIEQSMSKVGGDTGAPGQ